MGWQDTDPAAKGKIWFDEMKTSINQYNSESFCSAKNGQALPSKDDFELAEKHGVRDILKDMKNRWFWSSTLYPGSSDDAYVFGGYNGNVFYYYYRSNDNYNIAARCASAPGVNRWASPNLPGKPSQRPV
jgi:hypothetical protein